MRVSTSNFSPEEQIANSIKQLEKVDEVLVGQGVDQAIEQTKQTFDQIREIYANQEGVEKIDIVILGIIEQLILDEIDRIQHKIDSIQFEEKVNDITKITSEINKKQGVISTNKNRKNDGNELIIFIAKSPELVEGLKKDLRHKQYFEEMKIYQELKNFIKQEFEKIEIYTGKVDIANIEKIKNYIKDNNSDLYQVIHNEIMKKDKTKNLFDRISPQLKNRLKNYLLDNIKLLSE